MHSSVKYSQRTVRAREEGAEVEEVEEVSRGSSYGNSGKYISFLAAYNFGTHVKLVV